MAENKVAILGGKGMLGTDLVRQCQEQGIGFEVFDLPDFNITDPQQLSCVVNSASAVINCAAYTNVDGAESEAELANQINAEAVGRLGALAKEADVWVLHISTDFVFDGKSDKPYVETDPANPINTYGKSKLAGEKLLIESGCRHCIMRVEWTYGLNGNNFITKLIKRAKETGELKVVDDQTGSPTATTEAAKTICQLLLQKPEGLFHFAASGWTTRFDVAKFILETLDISVNLTPCKSSDYITPATRPLNSRFDCSKIQAILDEPIKMWQEPLKFFLEKL
jgi:dTDP-4-dehydrorhamnose reductase